MLAGTLGGLGRDRACRSAGGKIQRGLVLVDEKRGGMDVAFIAMLFMTSFTGMALLLLRDTAAMGPLLALHLGVVFRCSSPCPMASSCMASIAMPRWCVMRGSGS